MALVCGGRGPGVSKRSPIKLSPNRSTCWEFPAAGSVKKEHASETMSRNCQI